MLTNLGGTDMEQRPNRAAITKKGRERRERKSFTQIRLIFNKTVLYFNMGAQGHESKIFPQSL